MTDMGKPREGLAMLDRVLPQLLGLDAVTAAKARLQRFVARTAVEHPSVPEARGELLPVLCSLPKGPDADTSTCSSNPRRHRSSLAYPP
jgi:hypothetical protein